MFGRGLPTTTIAAGLLILAACSSPDDVSKASPRAGEGKLLVGNVERAAPSGDVDRLVQGMTRFGINVFGEVAEPDANVVLSPGSISMVFGMARAGAAGRTAAEIDGVLGFPGDAASTHGSFNALDQLLADAAPAELKSPDPDATRSALKKDEPPALEIANGVFPQIGFRIKQEFLATLGAQYGAGVIPVEFGAPDRAKRIIDEWVRRRTRGRIDRLFDTLDPSTRLVLANAVYLKADWLLPFAEEPTKDMPFTLADGSEAAVPTMQQLGSMRYAKDEAWQAVELPYVGERLAMWVLVPTGDRTPPDVLAPEVLTAVGDRLTEGIVDLHLPRWDFDTNLELIPILQALGMEVPFDPEAADFSGITDAGIWIDDAIHRATITVDEWGTEAAAVTGLSFNVSGPPPPDAIIHADRPFAFVIVDTEEHTPLFLGQVADPSA